MIHGSVWTKPLSTMFRFVLVKIVSKTPNDSLTLEYRILVKVDICLLFET